MDNDAEVRSEPTTTPTGDVEPTTDVAGPSRRPQPWQYVAVVVFLIVALGAMFWQLQSETPESHVDLSTPGDYVVKCEACGHELTAAERNRLTGDVKPRPGLEMRMECPACGELTARFAERCPRDGTVFFPSYKDVTPAPEDRCPKCGWSRLDEVQEEIGAKPAP